MFWTPVIKNTPKPDGVHIFSYWVMNLTAVKFIIQVYFLSKLKEDNIFPTWRGIKTCSVLYLQ